ncbi:MAG: class I SAM-dependent methyltransferase [Balneola sp.]
MIRFARNFFFVLYTVITKQNLDHFLGFKYGAIKKYYGKDCLDIGAGYGHFSDFLANNDHNVTAIDVTNKFAYTHNFSEFDGKKIPYGDKIFDTSILMFVLHHTDDQIELLKEAARVTKNYIIIGEDIMKSSLDRALGNIHLNTSPWAKSNDLFHTKEEWLEIFSSLNLKVVDTIRIPRSSYSVYPVNRNIYVLSV